MITFISVVPPSRLFHHSRLSQRWSQN